MNILMNLLGDASKASSRVRGYWIAEALESRGHRVKIMQLQSLKDYPNFLRQALSADATLVQKKYGRYDVLSAKILRGLGKPVVFDIDDAPSRVKSPRTLRNAARMMRSSKAVFAGCSNLVDLARESQPNTHLIPTGVQIANYRIKTHAPAQPVTLGWIGNGAHYVDDLIDILGPPVTELCKTTPVRFRLIGACGVERLYEFFGDIENLEIDFIDQLNWSDHGEVADALSQVDIGLYPLSDSYFNRFKCAFKALEYMATGLPVVASGVGANTETVQHEKAGFLCSSSDDWVKHLKTLIEDVSLRAKMGAAGRAMVEQNFDVAHLANRIEAIFNDAT